MTHTSATHSPLHSMRGGGRSLFVLPSPSVCLPCNKQLIFDTFVCNKLSQQQHRGEAF